LSSVAQPVVILGGFLSYPGIYQRMSEVLAQITGQRVWVVQAWPFDWLCSVAPAGWAHLLRKLERTVQQAVRDSKTTKITLVGHSSGGVMARLYLSPRPFLGHVYGGLNNVTQLITLGSPHYNQRGARMRRWVEQQYPGAYFAPQIQYASVAGKAVRGDRDGSPRERWAYYCYKRLGGEGGTWGDGLVPIASALLRGSHQAVLDGVSHFTGFGGPWYGIKEIVPRWWNACVRPNEQIGGKSVARNHT